LELPPLAPARPTEQPQLEEAAAHIHMDPTLQLAAPQRDRQLQQVAPPTCRQQAPLEPELEERLEPELQSRASLLLPTKVLRLRRPTTP